MPQLEPGALVLLVQPLGDGQATYSIVGLQTHFKGGARFGTQPMEIPLSNGIILRWERGTNGARFFIIRYTTHATRQTRTSYPNGVVLAGSDPAFGKFLRTHAIALLPAWNTFEAAVFGPARDREITDTRRRDGNASIHPQFWTDIQSALLTHCRSRGLLHQTPLRPRRR